MSERTRYFKIGVFFIVCMILFCVGLAMFGAGLFFRQTPFIFETYFNQSVQGLDVGAPVKFRGVRIGEVKEISFVKDCYNDGGSVREMKKYFEYILVRFSVQPSRFPRLHGLDAQSRLDLLAREHGLRVKLSPIGISGLNFLEIDFLPAKENPLLEIGWQPKRLYIPSAVSMLSMMGDTINNLATQLDENVYPLLKNLNEASRQFPEISQKLDETLLHTAAISRHVEDITSTAKKYPSQLVFGGAPPKSRFDK